MNSAQLIGNLTRDPDICFTKNGHAVALFTVACSRTYTLPGTSEQRELTDFIPCVAWGNLAENCGGELSKGSRVFVQGRISVRSYDGQDGQKRYRTEVICEFLAKTITDKTKGNSQQPKPAAPGRSFNDMGSPAQEEIPF